MNTRFHYLYRDGANYKSVGSVVFRGPPSPDLVERLAAAFGRDAAFIAHQVHVPERFHWVVGDYAIDPEYDHSWHSVLDPADCLEPTQAVATDPRTLAEFVEDMETASRGWDEFLPEAPSPQRRTVAPRYRAQSSRPGLRG